MITRLYDRVKLYIIPHKNISWVLCGYEVQKNMQVFDFERMSTFKPQQEDDFAQGQRCILLTLLLKVMLYEHVWVYKYAFVTAGTINLYIPTIYYVSR